jgi:hypothetical protein
MQLIDVTDQMDYGNSDDESLPILKCACGAKFGNWEHFIGIYKDSPTICPKCGRGFIFTGTITILEVIP